MSKITQLINVSAGEMHPFPVLAVTTTGQVLPWQRWVPEKPKQMLLADPGGEAGFPWAGAGFGWRIRKGEGRQERSQLGGH